MAKKKICKWEYNKRFNCWYTECGESYSLDARIKFLPADYRGAHGFTYCPYCRNKIVEVKTGMVLRL